MNINDDIIEMIYWRRTLRDIRCFFYGNKEEIFEINKEIFKKIGCINFQKFLQLMYSNYTATFDYTLDELKQIEGYESWIKYNPSFYTFILCTNNKIPNDIIKNILPYLKFGSKNPKNKTWIEQNKVYDLYYNDMLKYKKQLDKEEIIAKRKKKKKLRVRSLVSIPENNKKKMLIDCIINELEGKLGKVGQ